MVGGRCDVFQQFREEGVAICHDVHLTDLEGQGQILVDKQVYQRFLTFWHAEVMLFDETQHRALGQLVHLTLTNDALLAMADTEEEIEYHANHRDESNDQYPCHRLGRLAVVHQYMDNGCGCHHHH